jgi:hypothetical protein
MIKEKQHVIVLIENYWEGFFQSVAWLLALAAATYFSVWIGSVAMQWVMALCVLMSIISVTNEQIQKRRFTVSDAIKRLNEIQNERNSHE